MNTIICINNDDNIKRKLGKYFILEGLSNWLPIASIGFQQVPSVS